VIPFPATPGEHPTLDDLNIDVVRTPLPAYANKAEVAPLAALADMIEQAHPTVSAAAYAGYATTHGLSPLAEHTVDYLVKRRIDPEIAYDRGYVGGFGSLPNIEVPGYTTDWKWTADQQAWANPGGTSKGRAWTMLPWHDPSGSLGRPQIRWEEPRVSTRIDPKTHKEVQETSKFDFAVQDAEGVRLDGKAPRSIDALHADDASGWVALIEGPLKADALASTLRFRSGTGISLIALGGCSAVYDGKSNEANPSDIRPVINEAVAGLDVAGKRILWIPDSDHSLNPNVNSATQATIEVLLDAGASEVFVLDIPTVLVHPRSGREIALPDGTGIDDYSAHHHDVFGATDWLADLVRNAIEGCEYIAMWHQEEDSDHGRSTRTVSYLRRRRSIVIKETGAVLHWNGSAYESDPRSNTVTEAVIEASNSILSGSKTTTRQARIDARSAAKIAGAARLALARGEIAHSRELLDPEDYACWFPAANAFINLETGEAVANDPAHMNVVASPTAWNPDAVAPTFLDLIKGMCVTKTEDENGVIAFEPSPAKVNQLLMILGAFLCGKSHDIGPIFLGAGGAGMGTLMQAVQAAMGKEMCTTLASDALTGRGNQFSTWALPHKRVAAVAEPSPGTQALVLDQERWRGLTNDGDLQRVEPKGGKPYDTRTTWSLPFLVNVLPRIPGGNGDHEANERRVAIVAFPRGASHRVDLGPHLDRRLAAESEGILALMVRGAIRLHEWKETTGGRRAPQTKESQDQMYDWLSGGNNIERFLRDSLNQIKPDAFNSEGHAYGSARCWVAVEDLYWAYLGWCARQHISRPLGLQSFRTALTSRKDGGFPKEAVTGPQSGDDKDRRRGWRNWELTEDGQEYLTRGKALDPWD